MAMCPHCEVQLSSLDLEVMNFGSYRGVCYCCPSCDAVLGAEMDPIAVKSDIVSDVVREVKKAL